MLIKFTDDPDETSENEDELEDDSDYALSDVTKKSEIKQKRRRRQLSEEGTREREGKRQCLFIEARILLLITMS